MPKKAQIKGFIKLCHISEKEIVDFFWAIDRINQPMSPELYFSEDKLRQIAYCDICTFIVVKTYDLVGEVDSSRKLFYKLRRLLIQFLHERRKGRIYYRDYYDRLRELYSC